MIVITHNSFSYCDILFLLHEVCNLKNNFYTTAIPLQLFNLYLKNVCLDTGLNI